MKGADYKLNDRSAKRKDIYKITNKINGKVYIGQSVDYKKRFCGHKASAARGDSGLLYNAMRKYGVCNFECECLGRYDNYNEMERYYIALYESTNKELGYNICPGGEEPPRTEFLHYTKMEWIMVHDMLMYTTYTFKEISEMCNVNINFVHATRTGRNHRMDGVEYPLRVIDRTLHDNVVDSILKDLATTEMSMKEIAKKHNVSHSIVKVLNKGEHHFREDISYPIRETSTIDKDRPKNVKHDLMCTDLTLEEICEKYGCTKRAVRDINRGKAWFEEKLEYPLNKNLK